MRVTGTSHLWEARVEFLPGEYADTSVGTYLHVRPEKGTVTFIRRDHGWHFHILALTGPRVRVFKDGRESYRGSKTFEFDRGKAPEQFHALIFEMRARADESWLGAGGDVSVSHG